MELNEKQLQFIEDYMGCENRATLLHILSCDDCMHNESPGCGCCGSIRLHQINNKGILTDSYGERIQ